MKVVWLLSNQEPAGSDAVVTSSAGSCDCLDAPGIRRAPAAAEVLLRGIKASLAAVCVLGASALCAYAQVYSGSISGFIRDPSGAVVPRATVVAKDVGKGFTYRTTSNETGLYTIRSLPPSTYTLTVTAAGFDTASHPNVTLAVSQSVTIDVQMTIGSARQTVTVSESVPLLSTQDATTGQVVNRRLISDLPMVGRSAFDLAYLSPGVNPSAGNAYGPESRANNFTSNGGRGSTAQILLDGVPVTGPNQNTQVEQPLYTPSVDSIQEFKVDQNNFGADKGFSGNTVVNVVMRSGTNRLHGEGYEFFRDKVLNANNWFSNRAGVRLPASRNNDFGVTLGGPLQKDKTFFFVDYEGRRNANAATMSRGVPSEAERAGNFGEICGYAGGTFDSKGKCSKAAGQLWDPYSAVYNAARGKVNRTAFIPFNNLATYMSPGSPVLAGTPYAAPLKPGNLIDPVAARLMSYYPLPNVNVGSPAYNPYNNWAAAGTSHSTTNQFDVKVDRQVSDATHIDGRYSMSLGNSNPADLWGNPLNPGGAITESRVQSAVAHVTHSLSPTFLLTGSYGFTRLASHNRPPSTAYSGFNAVSDLHLPPILAAGGINVPPEIAVNGYTGGSPGSIGSRQYNLLDQGLDVHVLSASAQKIRGRHDLKFGGEIRMIRDNFQQLSYPGGKFTFNYVNTSQLSTSGSGGDAFASFLTGFASPAQYEFRPAIATQSFSEAAYFQDNWHATSRLTFNLGVRYELVLPRTERFNRISWFDPAAVSPLSGHVTLSPKAATVFSAAGLPVPGLASLKGGMRFADGNQRYPVEPYHGAVGPRLGFAYRLGGNTVVRGGYGIYYTTTNYTASGTGGGGLSGFIQGTNGLQTYEGNGYTPYSRMSYPFPDGLLFPSGSSLGLSTHLGTGTNGMIREWNAVPYEQTWSLGIQRQFGSVLVDAAYVGTKGTHLYSGGATNRSFFGPWIESATRAQITALNTKVPNPFYGLINSPGCGMCGPTITASQLLEPYPQFSGVSSVSPPWSNSIYNALQLKVEKRFSHGLELLGNYTWAKSIDDASVANANVASLGGTASAAQNPNHLSGERSLSEYDIPHVVSFSYVWELPLGRKQRWGGEWGGLVDAILGGWQMQGSWRFDSGMPIRVSLQTSSSLPTYGAQRPNLTETLNKADCGHGCLVGQYFANPRAAVIPASYTLGNAPRTIGSVRMEGTQNANLSLFKNFKIAQFGERSKLQVRIETFNALNHVQFDGPNTSVGNNTFGMVTGQANMPRRVQLGAKLHW